MKAWLALAAAVSTTLALPAAAKEYTVGGPLHEHDMEIVANYLIGIEMAPMTPKMPMGADVIHLEADIHATADNIYGYPDGGWVPYLTVEYTLEKQGAAWKSSGTLKPMIAKDGTALRRQREDGRPRSVSRHLPVEPTGQQRLHSSHRQGNRRAGLVEAIQCGFQVQVSAGVTVGARRIKPGAAAHCSGCGVEPPPMRPAPE